MENEQLYTLQDVARILRISEATVRRMCKKGRITYIKIGIRYRFSKNDLDKIINGGNNGKRES